MAEKQYYLKATRFTWDVIDEAVHWLRCLRCCQVPPCPDATYRGDFILVERLYIDTLCRIVEPAACPSTDDLNRMRERPPSYRAYHGKRPLSLEDCREIREACEVYARIGMWQHELVLDAIPTIDKPLGQKLRRLASEVARCHKALRTRLGEYEYYGITQDEVPDVCKIAYDVHQVVRHRLAWDQLRAEGKDRPDFPLVVYDEPLHVGTEPLITIEPADSN